MFKRVRSEAFKLTLLTRLTNQYRSAFKKTICVIRVTAYFGNYIITISDSLPETIQWVLSKMYSTCAWYCGVELDGRGSLGNKVGEWQFLTLGRWDNVLNQWWYRTVRFSSEEKIYFTIHSLNVFLISKSVSIPHNIYKWYQYWYQFAVASDLAV